MPDYKDLYFWLLNEMSEIRQKLESVEKNAERLRLYIEKPLDKKDDMSYPEMRKYTK